MNVTFTLSSLTWVFKAPQFGNGQNISFQRINRHTRLGDLSLYRDNQWPRTETLELPFDFASELEANRMRDMLKVTLGRKIQYLDHESVLWEGFIRNPETQITQVSKNSWTVNISFEGNQL